MVIHIQNELPKEVVEYGTFQRHFDRNMDRNGLVGYESNSGKWD